LPTETATISTMLVTKAYARLIGIQRLIYFSEFNSENETVERHTEEFLAAYLKELAENNAAVFVGAGLSKAAGYVDWPGLLKPIATELGLDVTKEPNLVTLAQYHLNRNSGNRYRLNQLLIDSSLICSTLQKITSC
jgi:hypothetical protein